MLDWFNGKKTTISAIAWPILTLAIGQGWITPDIARLFEMLLGVFTAGALGHKVVKAKRN